MGDIEDRAGLTSVRRLVVKLGSTTVASEHFERLVDEIASLTTEGYEIAVVSSGAVAMGMKTLELGERPSSLAQVQALAALGQADLMIQYNNVLGRRGLRGAQILLTHESLSHRRHFLNVRHTFNAVFDLEAIPIINENDTVAVEELRFGDNDRLAAAVATVMDAELVVLLSDVDALYDGDPRVDARVRPIRQVDVIDDAIADVAGASGSGLGTGGMASKVAAAKVATEAGIDLAVASGAKEDILRDLLSGRPVGTLFRRRSSPVARRRHWIGFLSKLRGEVRIDEGAVDALQSEGSSLLPIGVRAVQGHFERGDAVAIIDPEGNPVARGLVGYDAVDLAQICGMRSAEAARALGIDAADPVVHRNDLLMGHITSQDPPHDPSEGG